MSRLQINVRVGEELYEQIRSGADGEGQTISEFVRSTIAAPRPDGAWVCVTTDPVEHTVHATERAALRRAASSSTGGRVFFAEYGSSLQDGTRRAFGH